MSDETVAAAARLFPEKRDEQAGAPQSQQAAAGHDWRTVAARRTGYIQNADVRSLLQIAVESDTVVRMEKRIGDFVVSGCRLVSVANRSPDEELARKLNDCFSMDSYRTINQDVEFGIRIIVDVALRALSPGVHDPTTATVCIDYIGAVLAELVDRRVENPYRFEGSQLRVIAAGPSFASALDIAVDEIRRTAASNVRILLHLLGMLETVLEQASYPHRCGLLRAEVSRILRTARESIPDAEERAQIERAGDRLLQES